MESEADHDQRGVGGPVRSQTGQDQRAWEDRCGARQDRTRGLGRTRAVPGRAGPEGVKGPKSSYLHLYARGSQRSSRVAATKARRSTSSQPEMRGKMVASSFSVKRGVGLYIG